MMRLILSRRTSAPSSRSSAQRATKPRSETANTIASKIGRYPASNGQLMKTPAQFSGASGTAGNRLRLQLRQYDGVDGDFDITSSYFSSIWQPRQLPQSVCFRDFGSSIFLMDEDLCRNQFLGALDCRLNCRFASCKQAWSPAPPLYNPLAIVLVDVKCPRHVLLESYQN